MGTLSWCVIGLKTDPITSPFLVMFRTSNNGSLKVRGPDMGISLHSTLLVVSHSGPLLVLFWDLRWCCIWSLLDLHVMPADEYPLVRPYGPYWVPNGEVNGSP